MKNVFRFFTGILAALCFLFPLFACPAANAEGTEVEPEQQAEAHWYTFQIIGDSGLMSSTNVRYLTLYGPYYVSEENPVTIGRVKGMSTEVRVYTTDPEERVIWSYSPSHFIGIFLRSGIELPDPGPDGGDLALLIGDRTAVLSAEAQTELYALWDSIAVSGEQAEGSDLENDPDGLFSAEILFKYRKIPTLGIWTLLSVARYEDRIILLSWKECSGKEGYEADRVIEIEPDSELYRAFSEAVPEAGNQ